MTSLSLSLARGPGRLVCIGLSSLALLPVLVACSKSDSAAVTQAVAKVNKEEITELQVNQVLERQRALRPEMVEAASQRAVVALVDQEIVFQKARDLKLDREPRVVQAIESARREIITRAYMERVADGTAAASADEVRSYFDSKPALFKERRIYSLQELAVETGPERRAEVESQMKVLKTAAELEAYLREKKFRVRSDRSTVPAESIPLPLVERLAAVKPGSGLLVPAANGVRVIFVSATQDAPVSIEQARPAIETFLLNEKKRQTVDKEMNALRGAAKVEYLGKFKGLAASAPAQAAASEPAQALQITAPVTEAPSSAASGAMDANTLSKGMSGLK